MNEWIKDMDDLLGKISRNIDLYILLLSSTEHRELITNSNFISMLYHNNIWIERERERV